MYNTEIKRNILYALEKYYDNKNKKQEIDDKDSKSYNLNEIINKLLPYEDVESRKQALEECKKVMMLRNLFKSDDYIDDYYGKKLSIKLAEEYIRESKEDLPLVKEELIMFYLSERKMDKAKQLVIEILQEDEENKFIIHKYAKGLKDKGQFDEVLKFIEEIREFIKTDLLIFNLELDILLRKRDLQAIIDLCKNIPNLDLDKVREEEVNKLFFSKKRLKNVFGGDFAEDLKKIINLINRKYKDRGKELNERKRQFTEGIIPDTEKTEEFAVPIISDTQEIEKSEDEKRVGEINFIIMGRQQNKKQKKLKEITNEMENRIIAFISKCQIASALGRTGNDIASINLSKFLKDNKDDLSEIERKTLNMLQNFLTSKHAKFYLHNKWIEFQEKNFPRLLNPENEEKRTENKAQNEKNRNE